jgi:hypothetical protein
MSDEKRLVDIRSGVEFGCSSEETYVEKQKRILKSDIKGVERFAQGMGWQLYFLTLTLKSGESVPCQIDALMNFVRMRFKRAGLPKPEYACVTELQEKRYEATGVYAKHWHLLIAAPAGSLPNVKFDEKAAHGHQYQVLADGLVVKQAELYKRWGYGVELCRLAWCAPEAYLCKYLLDNLKQYGKLGRRYSSSMLGWWRFPKWAFECVKEFWAAQLDVVKAWLVHGEPARLLYVRVTDGVTMESYKVQSPYRIVLQ